MRKFRIAAVASLTLLAGAGVAVAGGPGVPQERMIEVPPGAVVVVLPGPAMSVLSTSGPAFDVGFPFPAMPSPSAMMRQANQMMAEASRVFAGAMANFQARVTEAATHPIPWGGRGVSGVFITSFSNGRGTCTRQVTYPGNGAAPVVKVSATGNACAGMSTQATAPAFARPRLAAPHLVEAANHSRPAPLEVAQLDR